MQLGFVSAILPELTLQEILAFAKTESFACVELICWPKGKALRRFAGVTHLDVSHFSPSKAADTLQFAAHHSVTISALGYYPNPLDHNPKIASASTDHLRRVILAASLLGINTVNTFVGRDQTQSVDENWPRFLKTWRPLIAFAEDHGVQIGIENCPMSFTRDEWPGGKNLATTPAIWRRMFHDIPSKNFGLNYDPSHFVLQGMDPTSPLREFREKLFHIHAKDLSIQLDKVNQVGRFAHPAEWHQPRIPGFGEISWPHFIASLIAIGYDGPVCIEVEDDSFGQTLAGRIRALKVARNILSPLVVQ
ncbi:MAG: sugar phosphate isomerase/epimerase [Verrucomicrobiota bacterium]